MKCGLYIIAHKEIQHPIYPKDRKIMLVGVNCGDGNFKQVPKGYCSDYAPDKENISIKNLNFCELTGLYYIVKNDNSDIISLEHYRRLFIKSLFQFNTFLTEKDILKLMKKYDLILPKKIRLKRNIYESYKRGHVIGDLEKVGEIIKEFHPDYYDSYKKVLKNHEGYFLNMFIGKKEVVEKYADWLFDILFRLEKMIDLKGRSPYQQRAFGFLSERMMLMWLLNHPEIKFCSKWVRTFKKLS